MRRSDGDAPHQTNQFLCVILIHFNCPGIIIIMPGSRKKNGIDGKSTNQLLDNLSGTGDRKSKRSCIAALAAVTPSTVELLSTSTPTLNLLLLTSTPTSNFTDVSSKSLTSNGSLASMARAMTDVWQLC